MDGFNPKACGEEEGFYAQQDSSACSGAGPSSPLGSAVDVTPVKHRNQANARERDRTYRTLIPTEPADRKLSKIETLRLASSYISHLGTQLIAGPVEQPCLRSPYGISRLSRPPSLLSCSNTVNYSTEMNNSPGPRPVCTFCLSSLKKLKPGSSHNVTPESIISYRVDNNGGKKRMGSVDNYPGEKHQFEMSGGSDYSLKTSNHNPKNMFYPQITSMKIISENCATEMHTMETDSSKLNEVIYLQ